MLWKTRCLLAEMIKAFNLITKTQTKWCIPRHLINFQVSILALHIHRNYCLC